MLFDSNINILSANIPTWIPLLVFILLVNLSIVWYQGKKDGFDYERLFDLWFLSYFFSVAFAKILFLIINSKEFLGFVNISFLSLNVYGLFIGLVVSLYILAHLVKWSIFRLLDIFSLGINFSLVLLSIAYFISSSDIKFAFLTFLLILTGIFLLRLRTIKNKSGYSFSVFALCIGILGFFSFNELRNLLFLGSFFTMSLVIILLKEKKNMADTKLPDNFVNFIKNFLQAKDKKLKKAQNILNEEDPYLRKGRSTDNADPIDDAILEDTQKETVEVNKESISDMQSQVRRALAKIGSGKYGKCEVCGKPIDKARLRIYPEATTCVEHMQK